MAWPDTRAWAARGALDHADVVVVTLVLVVSERGHLCLAQQAIRNERGRIERGPVDDASKRDVNNIQLFWVHPSTIPCMDSPTAMVTGLLGCGPHIENSGHS